MMLTKEIIKESKEYYENISNLLDNVMEAYHSNDKEKFSVSDLELKMVFMQMKQDYGISEECLKEYKHIYRDYISVLEEGHKRDWYE